ncbi:hypothetical protein IL252_16825 [Halomicrobium sp. IBSBa]|uniref:Uncharacterized protein n=1 Tax=Halomicrobium mukohataei TaxID=57705 RepID=A0A847U7R7_9EURY|nr:MULTISPECIES: hypothetical protein [Halomicrobium]MBO4249473.1 hypothetical protein [Halomicrobium sp. IBSBa]NLV08347.1 hypothetical protein [Halomicrobium mukohataei]
MTPETGEVVAVTTVDSEPPLLVTHVEADAVRGVLLADLAAGTIEQLNATAGDRDQRRALAQAVQQADSMIFRVPFTDCRHRGEPGIRGCHPPQGGRE